MLSLNLNLAQKIQGWNSQEEEHYPYSNNMLRILQSKIINSVRLQEQYQLKQYSSSKLNQMRPATVRVRPTTSKIQRPEIIQSHPTIDICNLPRCDDIRLKSTRNKSDHHQLVQLKYRNKSMGNNIKKVKNKQNIGDRQFHEAVQKQKQQKYKKGEQLQMKKQSLIFRNYNSLKEKKVINKFHEMEIKMRKNRNLHNKTALSQKQKLNIVIQSFKKGNDIGNNLEVVGDQNMFQMGIQKSNENNYIKLSRKQKLLIKQKQGKRKDPDVFADAHLTNLEAQ